MPIVLTVLTLSPLLLMLVAAVFAWLRPASTASGWTCFKTCTALASVATLLNLARELAGGAAVYPLMAPALAVTLAGAWLAVLVQLLGTVIGVFSSRYLQGEAGQARYVAAFAGVLAAVQLLLLADHWAILIGAWALAGLLLNELLCFYKERPFALLAAHKKRMADRAADGLLIAAAALAWQHTGSGSISALLAEASAGAPATSSALSLSALCVALAVIVRCALLPVHGWLTQVMEAPTPVSALLHAGVVNLGGFVLIRFAPLLEAAPAAQAVLVASGLTTAVLAGFVMLTRVSIKVRLAWSTVAQMGFMVLECGLGLYQLALLHLIGHSLYKAHHFLAASTVVQDTRQRMQRGHTVTAGASLLAAPALALGVIAVVQALPQAVHPVSAWPWWWTALLSLAWAPLLWLPAGVPARSIVRALVSGAAMVGALTLAALLGHALPLGAVNQPHHVSGAIALAGMALMYLGMARLQFSAAGWTTWRRWSYAGFYIDELYTRTALRLWPTRWSAAPAGSALPLPAAVTA